MHSVKILTKVVGEIGPRTEVWIDGKEFKCVSAISYTAEANEIHKVTLSFYAGAVEIADLC